MTYSLESLVFRAVGCAVNTAARAANTVLTVMYPREYPAHVWDDSPREGVEAALADPHPAGVDDPAGGSAASPAQQPPAGSLNLPWEVIDLTDPVPWDLASGFPWAIADRWGVIIGRFGTEDQAYAVVEAVSGMVGGPLLW